MVSRKMVLKNLFAGHQWRNRHREQTYGHGERGREVRCMERVTWKCTTPYVKYKIDSQWEFAVCLFVFPIFKNLFILIGG